MKMILQALMAVTLTVVTTTAVAQPPFTDRAMRGFPASMPVNENEIEWQRDVYREVCLDSCDNAVLCENNRPSLFKKLFPLVLRNNVPVYEYSIEGNEVFSPETEADIKSILGDYGIIYSEKKGEIIVDEENIPDDEVRIYYVKEGVCLNTSNGQFYRRVLAICPVLTREDDFEDGITKYPLFWLEYKDIEPYLRDFHVISDIHNNAVRMPAAEYFARNMYKGNIYKVYNLYGYSIPQYCETDSEVTAERKRIEREIVEVKEHTYTSFPVVKPSKYAVSKDGRPRAARRRNWKQTDKQ